jgi:hypothetical protein
VIYWGFGQGFGVGHFHWFSVWVGVVGSILAADHQGKGEGWEHEKAKSLKCCLCYVVFHTVKKLNRDSEQSKKKTNLF